MTKRSNLKWQQADYPIRKQQSETIREQSDTIREIIARNPQKPIELAVYSRTITVPIMLPSTCGSQM